MTDRRLAGPPAPRPAAGAQPRTGPAAPGRIRFTGLGYALIVLLTGTNLATPLHAAYEHVFHLSPLDVTLLVAVYAAAVMVALLARGPLSDTVGYRPVLVAAAAQAAGRRYRTDRALALGMMGLIVGLAGLIAAGAVGSAALLFGAIAVAGAGQG